MGYYPVHRSDPQSDTSIISINLPLNTCIPLSRLNKPGVFFPRKTCLKGGSSQDLALSEIKFNQMPSHKNVFYRRWLWQTDVRPMYGVRIVVHKAWRQLSKCISTLLLVHFLLATSFFSPLTQTRTQWPFKLKVSLAFRISLRAWRLSTDDL